MTRRRLFILTSLLPWALVLVVALGSWATRGTRFGWEFSRLSLVLSVDHSFGWGPYERRGFLGFSVGQFNAYHGPVVYFAVPIWFQLAVALATGFPLASELRRRSTGRTRVDAGQCTAQCTQCGYDLRASPRRCPECGTAAPTPS